MSTPTNTLVNGQLWRFTFKAGTQACEERREEHAQWDETRERRRLRVASVTTELSMELIDW